MDSDPTTRALDLLGLLRAGGDWTAAELAERLGVTARSVRRDVQRIRRLGYPVQSRPGPGSTYRLAAVKVPPLLFSEEEITAMVAGLRLVRAWIPDGDVAATALVKLEQVLPRPAQQRAAATDLVIEVLEQPGSTVSAAAVGLLADTVAEDGRVRFTYTDQHGQVQPRVVQPYRHVLRGGHSYLIGYDLERGDWRTFRLDRVTDLTRLPGTYRPRPFPSTSIDDWFHTDFGRQTNPPVDR